MSSVCPANERIKRRYFEYQRETLGLSQSTINQAAAAIREFEQHTGFQDFKKWSLTKAMAYKTAVTTAASKRTGVLAERATVVSKLRLVKNFFFWLATQPGYRSKITRAEAEYLSPSRHDTRLANAKSGREAPTLDQVRHVILSMPSSTDIELRDRALIACTVLTGARVSALISLKLKHVRADLRGIDQDARQVLTKFSKSQTTYFFPVGDDIQQIFLDYVDHLRTKLLWGSEDPLFPSTRQVTGADLQFHVAGLQRNHWTTPDSIRAIFKRAFAEAKLPYYSPHTFRTSLMTLGERICRTPEELKAFSQNLGHDEVRTSLTSYGAVPSRRQGEIIRKLGAPDDSQAHEILALLNHPEISNKLKGLFSDPTQSPSS